MFTSVEVGTPETCERCPRPYYTTIRYAGEETHVCRYHYRRYIDPV
jgi:hypothetical protein